MSGHDIAAATFMGQLRSMLRAFAWQDTTSPADNLTQLDRAMKDLDVGTHATSITARIEQDDEQPRRGTHTLRWSNAGNVAPILVTADGDAILLRGPADLLLGVAPELPRHDHTVDLPVASTILLFTDGLVESHDLDLELRLTELLAVAQTYAGGTLDEMLDSLLAAMVGENAD